MPMDIDFMLESCTLEYGFDLIDPAEYFNEASAEELKKQVSNVTQKVTKSNVVQKIIETIKKIGQWIRTQVQKVVNWITGGNNGGTSDANSSSVATAKAKKKTSINAIAIGILGASALGVGAAVGIKKVLANNKGKANGDKGVVISQTYIVPEGVEPVYADAGSNVQFQEPQPDAPADPTALQPPKYQVDNVQFEYESMIVTIENGDEIRFHYCKHDEVTNPDEEVSNPRATKSGTRKRNAAGAVVLLRDPSITDLLTTAINTLNDKNATSDTIETNWNNFYTKWKAVFDTSAGGANSKNFDWNTPIRSTDLIGFTQKFNSIMNIFDAIDTSNNNPLYNDQKFINVMNQVASTMATIQQGIFALTHGLSRAYKIDASLIGTIDTIEQLDQFVSSMINAGIPSKYISEAAVAVAGPSLKAKESPILKLPNHVYIYPQGIEGPDEIRIATNEKGRKINISNMNLAPNLGNLMVSVKAVTQNNSVYRCERVDDFKVALAKNTAYHKTPILNELKQNLQNAMNQTGVKINILSDLKIAKVGGNVGIRADGKGVYRGLNGQEMGVATQRPNPNANQQPQQPQPSNS